MLTGVSNEEIFKFLEYIKSKNKDILIRMVYVPKLTTPLDLIKVKKKYNLNNFEVLPFHKMCKGKYDKLGIKFTLENSDEPTKKECEELTNQILNS